MSQTTNAGIVTAYGAAVRGGYQGTYSDFCTDLANLAQVMSELSNLSATAETLVAGSSATATYANGVFTFGIPRGDKGEKGDTGKGIASVSLLSISGLEKTYRITFTDGTYFDYVVTDGKSIVGTTLNSDYTLTITYNDGTTWTSGSIRGATGATPNLTIGTVTTGAAGTDASASITGTAENPVLNLTIPKGADGDVSSASIASVYDATKTYAVGDYVWYSGQLYKCTTEIATAEAWTAAHWTAVKIADDVKDLKSAISEIADRTSAFIHTDFRTVENVVGLIGYNMGTNGPTELRANALSTYNAYYLYASDDFDIYFDTTDIADVGFIDISMIKNAQPITQSGTTYIVSGTDAVYYRKSHNNLPTAENPLHIPQGACVSITEGNVIGNWLVYMSGEGDLVLGADVKLNETQLSQTADALALKKCKLKYVSASPSNYVGIYVPNVNGYVKYEFMHDVIASINTDIWRVDGAYHTDDNLVQDYALTTAGEWEIAVKIQGRDDFSGGTAHGDEVLTSIVFIVDGKPTDITALTSLTEFDKLYIVENSNLYDPNDSETVFANHNSVHIFNKDGLTIKQACKFVVSETIRTAYMAMLPIAKTVSNRLVPNSDYVPITINNNRLYDVSDVTIYKSDGKVQANFYVPEFQFFGNNFKFLCLDNGGTQYNKCYFVNTLEDLNVSSGTIWKSETRYEFITS